MKLRPLFNRFLGWFTKLIPRDRVTTGEVPAYLTPALTVEIQLSTTEAEALGALASQVPESCNIVEIGSFQGGSTTILALGALNGKKSKVYAVDPHLPFRGIRGGTYGPVDLERLYKNIVRLGLGQQIYVICLTSVGAAKAWVGKNVGLLWIDGDHRYDAVRNDFSTWYEHVVNGGIIAFHDTGLGDVRRVINEALEHQLISLLGEVGEMAWFEKRET